MAKLTNLKPRLAVEMPSRLPAPVEREEKRGKTAERGYGSWWQRESSAYRERFPACAYCWLYRRHGPAELVDHLYPHGLRRGAQSKAQHRLFRDKAYWVSACHGCHRGFKQSTEALGIAAIDDLAQRLGLNSLTDPELRGVCITALACAYGVGGDHQDSAAVGPLTHAPVI